MKILAVMGSPRQVLPADDAFCRGRTYHYATKINPVKAASAIS